MKTKRVVLYFEENEKAVVFDIIFCGYKYLKWNRKEAMLFDIIFSFSMFPEQHLCSYLYVYMKTKEAVVFDIFRRIVIQCR